YRSELVSAGMNQTLHRIALQVTVFAQIYIPWAHISAEIDNEVLIAETVIVGSVPETYLNME
ncbi:MAG: sporulation protein YunB, partial [Oscillospiraceae bacterium]|nr:sporulation protein YunB [Oscillospiraceae bacterium]